MSSNHKHPSAKVQDEELSRQVTESLERSLDNLDDYTLARLAKARRTALERRHQRQWLGGVAVAASLAALMVIPIAGKLGQQSPSDFLDNTTSYLQEDSQMLLDMEMLLAIGESGSES